MVIKPLNILGLAGGASLDGIKAELVNTDGVDIFETKLFRNVPYSEPLFKKIRKIIGKKITNPEDRMLIESAETEFSAFLLALVQEYMTDCELPIEAIALEGPTICHEPENVYTYQLGKGQSLVNNTGIKVISHFHNTDMLNGGIGTPITASYYASLAQHFEKPVLFITLGGAVTVTHVGTLGEIYAFNAGPGTAIIDEWMIKHGNQAMDYNGKFAALGQIDEKILSSLMKHRYFSKYPPKYIHRDGFNDKLEHLEGLSVADGAATATAFVAQALAYSLQNYLPESPTKAILCGGGAYNPTLVRFIRQQLRELNIQAVTAKEENLEINEAQATAFLAARRLYTLPITFPTTTGVPMPVTGGKIYEKEF